jgi:flagellar basal-body rod protein FlgB
MSAEPLSVVVASRALDGLMMRMSALAHNMANAGSPQFRSVTVNFEEALGDAATKGPDAVKQLRFGFAAGPVFDEHADRRLDLLIADASRTAGRFAAIADMMGRRMALQQIGIGGQR